MVLLAFALLAILPLQQARGPAAEDDGTGRAARVPTRQRCPAAAGPDEIVLCRRGASDRDRIGPALAAPAGRRAIDPALRLPGGGELRAEAQQHDAGITTVPAAFVSVRIPLGRKKKKPDLAQK